MDKSNLSDGEFWKSRLGLYPIPLYHDDAEGNQFILVNGTRGNFCLDLESQGSNSETRNTAWSSNVGHYIGLVNGSVEVQRWDRGKRYVEKYTYDSVLKNLDTFYSHLEKDEPRRELSIVSHVIRVFRILRSVIGSDADGSYSLKAFLYLLACAIDESERNELAIDKWRLDRSAVDAVNSIRPNDWQTLFDELILGRPLEDLKPNPMLMLRHAAGQIFQEAHYEAIAIPSQRMLTGFAPPPVKIGRLVKGIGVHFTPPALARTLVEEAFHSIGDLSHPLVIFDPACGSGEFLREALRYLKINKYEGPIKLIGWDISQAACDMANYILGWETRGHENHITIEIVCRDSITADSWPKHVSVVIMNPPFVSWQEMIPEQREAVAKVLGALTNKRPDLSSAFVFRAQLSVTNGGVLATILPASFLDGDSFDGIRASLANSLSTKLVARLGSHQLFPNTRIDAAYYVGRANGERTEPTVAFWADHRPQSASAGMRALRRVRHSPTKSVFPVLGDGYNLYLNSDLGKDEGSWAPRPFESWELLKSLAHLPTVKDSFDVKQGVLSGLNKAFVLSKVQVEEFPKTERAYFRPAVLNESIRDGRLIDSAYIFYPYGKFVIRDEPELRRKLTRYYEKFLLPNKDLLQSRARIDSQRWWVLSEHRTWQEIIEPKIVSTYFGDSGSFAWDSTGRFVVVQGYAWLPRARKSVKSLPIKVSLAYLAILNSQLFSTLLSAVSNHVGGGQWNLSKRFVNRIPLPELLNDDSPQDLIFELAKIGDNIASGGTGSKEKSDELVRAVYGLD